MVFPLFGISLKGSNGICSALFQNDNRFIETVKNDHMLSTFQLQSPCALSLHFIHLKQHFFRDINSFTKYSKIQSYCWSIQCSNVESEESCWCMMDCWTAVMQCWCTASAIVVKQWGMVATSDQLLFFSPRSPSTPSSIWMGALQFPSIWGAQHTAKLVQALNRLWLSIFAAYQGRAKHEQCNSMQ